MGLLASTQDCDRRDRPSPPGAGEAAVSTGTGIVP